MSANSYELNQIASLLNTIINEAKGSTEITPITIKDFSTVAQTGNGLINPDIETAVVGYASVGYAYAG